MNYESCWKVIYHKGDRSVLSIAEMPDEDSKWEYDFASEQSFEIEDDAYAYMIELAAIKRLIFVKKI